MSKHEQRSYYDTVNNVEYVNLVPYMVESCQEYSYYVAENELGKLSKREKNQLGTHFMLNQVLNACKASSYKKCFYYKEDITYAIENLLIKRIFSALPTKVIYGTDNFDVFIQERDYYVLKNSDMSVISFMKFRKFLKKQGLTKIEDDFLKNHHVKLSLMP